MIYKRWVRHGFTFVSLELRWKMEDFPLQWPSEDYYDSFIVWNMVSGVSKENCGVSKLAGRFKSKLLY